LFNEHFGLSSYFEYTEKITVTNAYLLIGPAVVFGDSGFFDELKKRRNKQR